MIFRGSFYSRELDRDTWVTIAGPRDEAGHPPYRTVYLLHGWSGNSGNWADRTLLPLYAEKYDVMFILPEGDNSFYTNSSPEGRKDGLCCPQYFSYVTEELPKIIESIFQISSKREDTAVMGNSMGGYGALKCALAKPGQYHHCAAFSPAQLFWEKDAVHPWAIDLIKMAKEAAEKASCPRLFLSCGRQDELFPQHERLVQELSSLPLDMVHEEPEGLHDWYFWNSALGRAMEHFYGPSK